MPKKPLTPQKIIAKALKNDAEIERLNRRMLYRLKLRNALKALLGIACTPTLNLNLPEDTNASA
jgi:hypothetical protein